MNTPLVSTATTRPPSPVHAALWRIAREPRVLFGAGVLLLLVIVALCAPAIAPYRPDDQDLLSTLLPPAWAPGGTAQHWFGTDSLGRDVLSLAIYGARIAVLVGFIAPLGTALIGGVLAVLAGWFGGKVDWLVLRVVEVWMSFPAVVLALVLVVAMSPSIANVIVALVFVDWTRFCRVLRAEVIVIRRRDYVAAARIAGAGPLATILRDVLPALMPTLITLMSLEVGIAIVAECSLSFVGLSADASQPSWGTMVSDGLANVFTSPWGLILPIACLVLSVLATTFLGEGLRRTTDSRLLERSERRA
ncbi:peptide/nickel transport system permease protein [Paraburkholderia fungorum]|uniref:Peptide/nickel transport system permease protein n=1 Tax=Paraburkholderia fungorum TaxID=134537 RepID=A0A1H1JMG4_9BURK|nr:ABC transporter permease [Paraburkholderia fungorum]SDR51110.1 peptide/nickel transport system permease protein [Paraburkholderia fungorum]